MKSLICIIATVVSLLSAGANEVTYKGVRYTVARFAPKDTELKIFWQDANEKPYITFKNLQAAIPERILFFTNGGIFASGYKPLGLYVEDGKELVPINTDDAPGNFFLKPNGIFFIDTDEKAGVMETEAFAKDGKKVRLAVQSGPLLLSNGELHPKFNEPSPNRLIRNAVGVDSQGRMVFIATVREQPKFGNFWELATMFRDQFDCPNALFLDGDISSLLLNPQGQERTSGFASMLVVLEKPKPKPAQ